MTNSLKPSVCIDAVLENIPLEDALKIVADSGIDAFEFWCWWEKDLEGLCKGRDANRLSISACCTKFVSLVDPAKRSEYLDGLEQSIAAAKTLNCPTLISQVGDFRKGVSREEQSQSLKDGLFEAAPLLEAAGITLVIEPLNERVDHAGYFLIRSDEAFSIVDAVGSPRVKVVFDIYHQQISEGNVIHNLVENIDRIAHFHAAGNPGRHELTRGELHYERIFDAIRSTNYHGYVGLEYWPKEDAAKGLRQVAKWFE